MRRDRPTTAERGYNGFHQALRRKLDIDIRAGHGICVRCGYAIDPDEQWDLGHSDTDRSVYSGPEHRHCNRATNTNGRATAERRRRTIDARIGPTPRAWVTEDTP